MTFILAPFVLAAAVAAGGVSAPLQAVSVRSDSPVQVIGCDYSTTSMSVLSEGGFTPDVHNLRLTFENRAGAVAKSVRFAVNYGGVTQAIEDKGNFSNGARIEHDFFPNVDDSFGSSAVCAVKAVTFSDGSSWRAS